ncbi:MAG: amidohydrolase, partial [Cellvibrionales bacterium]|nr:amidohydrolase [Cellvibrionales bacterium]
MSFRVGLVVLAAFLAGVLVLFQIATRPPEAPPHHVFVNGIVLTMDDRAPMVEAVSVRHDRIESVGSSEEILALAGDETTVTDLRGRTLMPGFVDAHGHFPGSGWTLFS